MLDGHPFPRTTLPSIGGHKEDASGALRYIISCVIGMIL
jgi:hypothetical protein